MDIMDSDVVTDQLTMYLLFEHTEHYDNLKSISTCRRLL